MLSEHLTTNSVLTSILLLENTRLSSEYKNSKLHCWSKPKTLKLSQFVGVTMKIHILL